MTKLNLIIVCTYNTHTIMGGSSDVDDCADDMYQSFDENEDEYNIVERYRSTGSSMYIASCRFEEYVNIPCWAFNRRLDIKRVNKLYKEIVETGFVCGVSTIARCDIHWQILQKNI